MFITGSTIEARLTPYGKNKYITGLGNTITKFVLGDSDANYNADDALSSGYIPAMGGDRVYSSTTYSNTVNLGQTTQLFSKLYSTNGTFYKQVEPGSTNITQSTYKIGQVVASGASIYQDTIVLSAASDSLINLYKSFRLPITPTEVTTFTSTTLNSGGWANTALSGLSANNILIFSVSGSSYGDIIDGKEFYLRYSGASGTIYRVYSTFQNKPTFIDDNQYQETSTQTTYFGQNYAFLFSDQIRKPNDDSTKSWATGFGLPKPFSVNGKARYNLTQNSSLSQNVDKSVGVVFLDKGIAVITDPTIVADFTTASTTSTTITMNSVSIDTYQEILCIANRNEFTSSNNSTYNIGDDLRISEIGLYDASNNLVAYGKTNRHITKKPNEFKGFSVKIRI